MVSTSLSRRQIARGAAWAVPAVLAASSVPAYAASVICGTGTFVAPAPSSTSADALVTTWVVPENVTKICVSVLGGGGGRSFMANMEGGAGALINAEIPVQPGQKLTFVVAAGGAGATGAALAGGGGYGAGGDVKNDLTGSYRFALNNFSGSGGGASAILLGDEATGTPLVVAGGGGGGGFYGRWIMNQTNVTPRAWTISQRAAAGSASTAAGPSSIRMENLNMSISTGGGGGANSGAAGAGGVSGNLVDRTNGAVTVNELKRIPGLAGGTGFRARGADALTAFVTHSGWTIAVRSGAGGGGYGGGGSGSAVAVATTASGALASAAIGASGGGGGSFVASQAQNVVVATGSNGGMQRDVRNPGSIIITF